MRTIIYAVTWLLLSNSIVYCLPGSTPLYASAGYYNGGSDDGNISILIFSSDFHWDTVLPQLASRLSPRQATPEIMVSLAVPSVHGSITLEGRITHIGHFSADEPELVWVAGHITQPPASSTGRRSQDHLFNMFLDLSSETVTGK